MSPFNYTVHLQRFDEHYEPAKSTRLTTNFANLARGEKREQNLRNTLDMINQRFNDLASWDNPTGKRYTLELDILSGDIDIEGNGNYFPAIEFLKPTIIDHQTGKRFDGIIGNNFSSFVRDYDFSVLLRDFNQGKDQFSVPDNYGVLQGKLYKHLLASEAYKVHASKLPVICLSVSHTKTYHQTTNVHPILGVEYRQNEYSLTDDYFAEMGMKVRYFMPPKAVAPFAFYFQEDCDLLNDYSNLELISTISTMETFQKIYRPEIYNANAVAGQSYQPSLTHPNYSATQIYYDRVERTQLATRQGEYTRDNFIRPFKALLEQWAETEVR